MPQVIPKVSQPGQWNVSPHTCGNTQGVVQQPATNSSPMNNSHMYDQVTANHGSNLCYTNTRRALGGRETSSPFLSNGRQKWEFIKANF